MTIPRIVFLFVLSFFSLGSVAQQGIADDQASIPLDTNEVILVAGATGPTGSRFVQQLKDLCYENILSMTLNNARSIL